MLKQRVARQRRKGSMLANLLAPFRRTRQKFHTSRERRRLRVDALEERMLLSVTPVDILDKLVNQSLIPSGGTIAGQSVAVDTDGDFVVVWTRYDTIIDPNTNLPLIDPLTGQPQTEANIYARYLTDEVQRITLPSGVLNDTLPTQYGRFSLIYGGTTLVQKLTISATYEPFTPFQNNIAGTFVLQADANGDGIISPTERATIVYDETTDINTLASSIQTALQGIGGPLQNAKVRPVNAKEFVIEYGSAALGVNQPKLSVANVSFTSGFYPAVQISTVREPILISNVPISPTDPQLTAQALEQAFNTRLQAYALGPIDFPPPNRVPSATEGPYTDPLVVAASIPQISVTAVNATTFDIRFIGDSGKQDHPELIIAAVTDELGNSLLPSPQATVRTLKQSSPEFRVNPEEPDDPFTPGPDKYNQTNPAVAMDADGDFVIVWESEVPNSVTFASVSDIFARRFRPVGVANLGVSQFVVDMNADGIPETPIDGILPLLSPLNTVTQTLTIDAFLPGVTTGQFRLSVAGRLTEDITFDSTQLATTAANIQGALVMAGFQNVTVQVVSSTDPYKFRVTFTQTFSGPNGLADAILQYVDPSAGVPLSSRATISSQLATGIDLFTFRVNTETLRRQFAPAVAMDMLGNFVIAWANSAQDFSYYNGIKAQIFDRNGNKVGNEFLVNAEDTAVYLNPAVGMARTGEFVIAWERTHDVNYLTGGAYATAIQAKAYNLSGQVILPQFGIGGGGDPAIAFDSANHFLVTWNVVGDPDNTGQTTMGVRGIVYDLNGNTIRDVFRANSATFDPGNNTLWPLYQGRAQGGLDADGDMVVVYDGYGPDVSENVSGFATAVQQLLRNQINATTNADLLNYFDPQNEYLLTAGSPSNGDVDGVINAILIRALNRGANAEQVGRLRAILDSVAGLLRGEANGVMFSRFDASPTMAYTTLFSDSVANTVRDGRNTRYLILMNANLNWESFIIRLYRDGFAGYEDITINNIQTNQNWNIALTRDRIDQLLEGAARTGTTWAEPRYEGSIDVRILSFAEVASRIGTPWQIPVANPGQYVIYEVTFQGEGHDWPFYMTGVFPGRAGGNDVAPPLMIAEAYGDSGVTQANASMGITPEGSFVVVYTQYEENTDGSVTNATIRYRQFQETADTAGPFVTDILAPTGTSLWGGATVEGSVNHIVITFNEELLRGDPQTILDSVLNPENFVLYRNGVEIPRGVVKVDFGMNAASLLNGTTYDVNGDGVADGTYQLYSLPTNKWEAVLTLDGNGALESGIPGLADGDYQLVIRAPSGANSGIRDKAGNALNSTGFVPAGADATLSFHVTVSAQDQPVLDTNARTQPESPNAVARDADGDYVVVWTQTDALGRNRVYFRMYDRDGTPANLDLNGNGIIDPWEIDNAPATPVTTSSAFAADDQQYASVAMTPDGDFVITWTNTRSGNADIYARRFASSGQPLGEAFLVNSVTGGDQKWSDVAMDAEGNFVVAWSSWGQETGGVANRWGIFARRFDQLGQPLGTDFAVNTVVAGDQVLPSVSMDYRGNFAIAWQTGGDIALRTYALTGVAQQAAEIALGASVIGQKAYPDVAMAASGQYLVVSWMGPDGNGNGVYVDLLQWDPVGLAWTPVGTSQLVNTTVVGEQGYASVAMAVNGSFVVSWSGIGTQMGQEDQVESGVFYQQFSNTGTKIGGERRVNQVINGKQWAPSVGADADGNFIVVFTGPSMMNPALTTVYRFDSRVYLNQGDVSAPIVTKVLTGDGTLVTEGARVTPGPQQLVVVLSEAMSQRLADINGDGLIDSRDSAAPDSVLNLQNWKLFRDGQEVVGAIKAVSFRYNDLMRRYEAVLTLDSNPVTSALDALVPGEYQLVVGDVMTDEYPYFRLTDPITGRQLDGDRDGVAGTAGGAMGFVRNFRVIGGIPGQDTSVIPGVPTQNARTQPESPNAVARDADGDYVVVWTQTDASGRNRVYFRLFDRDGTPADLDLNGNGVIDASEVNNAPATPVTTSSAFATDDQQYASVAMTPDGDFVITWTNTRNGNADVYARRFAANGQPLGEAFLVNTFTTNDQKWSDVAMDAEGRFVVVWSSLGQETGTTVPSYGIFARRFDENGQAVGAEFQINTTTAGDQMLPSVSMDYRGNFGVAWQTLVGGTNTDIAVSLFDWAGTPLLAETIVNVTTLGPQTNPDIALAAGGRSFVVTWASADGSGTGVFAQLYAWDPVTLAWVGLPADLQVNTTVAGDQRFASVSMDALGNFVVAWSGMGNQLNEEDLAESGVFYQRFDATGNRIAGERRVNQVVAGKQWLPSVAADADGNFIVVFTGPSSVNPTVSTIYAFDSRTHLTLDDIAAPIVTKVWTNDRQLITEGSRIATGPTQLIVQLSEEMSQRLMDANGNGIYDAGDVAGPDSVVNRENWRIFRNGQEIVGAVKSVTFSFNPLTRKWEAVLTLDGNPDSPLNDPLPSGDYQLLVADLMTDAYPFYRVSDPVTGFQLDGDRDAIAGTVAGLGYVRTFIVGEGSGIGPGTPGDPGVGDVNPIVNTTLIGNQGQPAVGMNANGDYVVVWVSPGQGADATTTATNIIAQRYNRRGEAQGTEFIVNNYETGDQNQPAVAMDSAGNFIVVWAGAGADDTDGVWARIFDRFGNPLGDQFRVNQYRANAQYSPKVAVDAVGNFVVTWSSYGQDGDKDGVYARLYNAFGQARSDEFRVNTTTANYQRLSDVAMDDAGNFVVVWMSYGQDGSGYAVMGRVFNANGSARTGELRINQYTTNDQIDPRVAMDPSGNFVVTWSSFGQDGSGYGVFARLYSPDGTAKGNEFRVNQTTLHWQYRPDVAMDRSGNFTIVWMTSGQDNDLQNDWGIYARMFTATGADYVLPPKGHVGEFRVNAAVEGNQTDPAIAMDAVGNFIVAWAGPSTNPDPVVAAANGIDIFARLIDPPNQVDLQGTAGNDTLEFVAGSSLATSVVKLNGTVVSVPTSGTSLVFEGLGGVDTVIVTGTSGKEVVTLWPTGGTFQFPGGFTLEVRSVEKITVDAKGGTDELTVYDSSLTDTMTATPTQVTAASQDGSFSHSAKNFETVTLISTAGGEDLAMLYDSAGNDTFVATPTYIEMSGTGYKLRAEGFRYGHGYASAGGIDTAMMYDSAGDDEYVCTPDYNILRGDNFFIRAKFFDYVHAYATAGGYDKATIKGSTGADKIVIDPQVVRLSAGSYVHRGKFFEEVTVRGGGGQDIAYVYDGVVLPGMVARGVAPVPLSASQLVYLQQLYKIQTYNEGGTGTNRTIRPAVDAVFSAYWP
jgi:hypothetical protein